MKYSSLYIRLRGKDTFELEFRLIKNAITEIWVERMLARKPYPLDSPDRFYGVDSIEIEQQRAEQKLLECINTINAHTLIIDKAFTSIHDQDYLNYLHNVFERFHGLLNQQEHDYWQNAPTRVQRALANLNLAVHRCEAVSRVNYPRLVCTWFGLPKIKTLTVQEMQSCGELNPAFGSVCINYAEIGKTLEDLALDNDNYIGDDAFRPFNHISADFNVRFFEESSQAIDFKIAAMRNYFNSNASFFVSRGFNKFDDPRLQPLRFSVAQLVETMPRERLLKEIQQRQYVEEVTLV